MSDDITTTAPLAEPTPAEAEKARKARTVYPITILILDEENYRPAKGAPTFTEQREADAWIATNANAGMVYTSARIGRRVRIARVLEEVPA